MSIFRQPSMKRNPATKGLMLHGVARYYDLLAWLLLRGREQAFRKKLVALARLQFGEAVLDIGCGTGTLAIAAKRRVGPPGKVYGIDASPEMIAKATKKARKAAVEIEFRNEIAEALSFQSGQFDAVLSTLMLHHLPRKTRVDCLREIRRVLKPGGRALAVDFGATEPKPGGLLSRLNRRHGHVKLSDMIAVVTEAGLNVVESGAVGFSSLNFVLGACPRGSK